MTEAEIFSDGHTVWVNTDICLGRFGRTGVDVHHGSKGQAQGHHCLDCFPRSPDAAADWERFKQSMQTHHGVEIPDVHRPTGARP